ncbi:MAG: hypothetical protein ACLQO6_17475, partial [Desulfomonilaceae bacterium]
PPFLFHVPRVEDDQEELLPKLKEPELLNPPPYLPARTIESPIIKVNRKNITVTLKAPKTRFLDMRKSPMRQ